MKSKLDFVQGDTRRCLLAMVGPLLAAMILTMMYNLVDSLWVGNLLGETGYAALTASTAVVLVLNAIAMGSGNGLAIAVAQAVGSGRQEDTEGIIATALALSAAFSAAATVAAELSLGALLRLLGTPPAVYDLAARYLAIYLLGYWAIFLYMQFTSIFRAFGDPMLQMKGMLLTTAFNAVLDPILIHFFGLSGAAWATVASEVLCLVYALAYHRRAGRFALCRRAVSRRWCGTILKQAVPAAVQSCMPAISSAAMMSLVTSYGVSTLAAYGVTNKLEILLFYPAMAMNMALAAIIGQCVGAGRPDRGDDYLRVGLVLGGGVLAAVSAVIIAFCGPLSGLFVDSAAVAAVVQGFFRIVSVGYVLYMLTSCFLGKLSGYGRAGLSLLAMFVYYIVIRIPLANVLVAPLGLNGVWAAILISHILAAVLAACLGAACGGKRPAPQADAGAV